MDITRIIEISALVTLAISLNYSFGKIPRIATAIGTFILFGLLAIFVIGIGQNALSTSSSFWGATIIILGSFLFWVYEFHTLARMMGPPLSRGIWGEFIAQHWVKLIDYVYLSASVLSLVRLAYSAPKTGGPDFLTSLAAMLLGMAVALRITKTSVEIFQWDKEPSERRR